MKTKLFLPVILLGFFFANYSFSQISEETIKSHKENIENKRAAKDQQMQDSESSPIPSDKLAGFSGLDYYPIDIKYQINAQFVAADPQVEVALNTTTDGTIKLIKYGTVSFELEGKSISLSVFQNNNLPEYSDNRGQLFIPFSDKTSGKKTNKKGRYLPIDIPADGNTVVLDFNNAMNPFSAYNEALFSVIPPEDNEIEQTIGSGERKFEDR